MPKITIPRNTIQDFLDNLNMSELVITEFTYLKDREYRDISFDLRKDMEVELGDVVDIAKYNEVNHQLQVITRLYEKTEMDRNELKKNTTRCWLYKTKTIGNFGNKSWHLIQGCIIICFKFITT